MTIAQLAIQLDQLITSKIEQLQDTGKQIKVLSPDADDKTKDLLHRKMLNLVIQLRPVLPLVYAKYPQYQELFEELLKKKTLLINKKDN